MLNGLGEVYGQIDLLLDRIEDGGLQLDMFDRVLGTGTLGLVLISTAVVVHRIAHFAAGHCFSAISAFQKATEQV